MRSIVNKKDNSKRNQLILGIFLIIIMVFSTLGYALAGRDEGEKLGKIEYKGIEFIQDTSRYWVFNTQGYEFITKYNPEEVEDIEFSSSLDINGYFGKPLYFAGEVGDASSEIIRNFGQRIVLRIQEACLDETCETDLPIKDCSIDNIIIINSISENEVEKIYQEEKCIFIFANDENQVKYIDKYLFDVLGI